MKKTALLLCTLLCLAGAAVAQMTYDRGIISPYIESPSNPLAYVFTNYEGGASEAGYYYLFTTNITGYTLSPRNYKAECVLLAGDQYRQRDR